MIWINANLTSSSSGDAGLAGVECPETCTTLATTLLVTIYLVWRSLTQQGKDTDAMISKADHDRAIAAWAEYSYGLTHTYSEKIIGRCPEPMLLPILGLILLSAPQRGGTN